MQVPAAYAAGLLTLEEAVKVVYHRSTEQQKMAGCGRLLVVGMNVEKLRGYIKCVGGGKAASCLCVCMCVVCARSTGSHSSLFLATQGLPRRGGGLRQLE